MRCVRKTYGYGKNNLCPCEAPRAFPHFSLALSPAADVKVISLKNNLAQVEVPEDQLALAIGAGGENVRLAGILTDTDIKVGAAKKN